jgi:hypothetical protein
MALACDTDDLHEIVSVGMVRRRHRFGPERGRRVFVRARGYPVESLQRGKTRTHSQPVPEFLCSHSRSTT